MSSCLSLCLFRRGGKRSLDHDCLIPGDLAPSLFHCSAPRKHDSSPAGLPPHTRRISYQYSIHERAAAHDSASSQSPTVPHSHSFRGSRLKAQGSRLKAQGSRLKARGSRLEARGSIEARGSRLSRLNGATAQGTSKASQGSRFNAQRSIKARRLKAHGSRHKAV